MAQLSNLGVAALRIRNASPDAFNQFLVALKEFADAQADLVVSADAASVLNMQGRAQSLKALLRTLNECAIERTPKPTP